MNVLKALWRHGQSLWLDNLTRAMLLDGELARRVEEHGVRGVTSNPAIFHKAIGEGAEYDEDIARFGEAGLGVEEVYERLTISDVRGACDVLSGVWRDSGGVDGYVSLEVSPHLAHDTEGTLAAARRLFEAVDRPNALIKIPGTEAGVPAIRQALFEGVNVNITLLFSIEAYEAVALAYVEALEQRLEAGRAVDGMASVAIFLLSRIDTLVDARLAELREGADPARASRIDAVRGGAAVANAKLAYRSFERLSDSPRWRRLVEHGAKPQRMLWASTSTKDPAYRDVKYVEPLIGPLTINTMPESTMAAFLDHGVVADTVRDGIGEAEAIMAELAALGVDFGQVTAELLVQGVQKFIDPYDRLLAGLQERLSALAGQTA